VAKSVLDFEKQQFHTVIVKAVDEQGAFSEQTLEIQVQRIFLMFYNNYSVCNISVVLTVSVILEYKGIWLISLVKMNMLKNAK